MCVGIDDRGWRFEDVRLGENLQAHGWPVYQRINRIHITAGGTDVADAHGQPHAHAFRQHFRRSDKWESWCSSPLLVHGFTSRQKGVKFYPECTPPGLSILHCWIGTRFVS